MENKNEEEKENGMCHLENRRGVAANHRQTINMIIPPMVCVEAKLLQFK